MQEDIDLGRRVGRVKLLAPRAISNAAGYRREGYLRHAMANQRQRLLHALRLTPAGCEPLPGSGGYAAQAAYRLVLILPLDLGALIPISALRG